MNNADFKRMADRATGKSEHTIREYLRGLPPGSPLELAAFFVAHHMNRAQEGRLVQPNYELAISLVMSAYSDGSGRMPSFGVATIFNEVFGAASLMTALIAGRSVAGVDIEAPVLDDLRAGIEVQHSIARWVRNPSFLFRDLMGLCGHDPDNPLITPLTVSGASQTSTSNPGAAAGPFDRLVQNACGSSSRLLPILVDLTYEAAALKGRTIEIDRMVTESGNERAADMSDIFGLISFTVDDLVDCAKRRTDHAHLIEDAIRIDGASFLESFSLTSSSPVWKSAMRAGDVLRRGPLRSTPLLTDGSGRYILAAWTEMSHAVFDRVVEAIAASDDEAWRKVRGQWVERETQTILVELLNRGMSASSLEAWSNLKWNAPLLEVLTDGLSRDPFNGEIDLLISNHELSILCECKSGWMGNKRAAFGGLLDRQGSQPIDQLDRVRSAALVSLPGQIELEQTGRRLAGDERRRAWQALVSPLQFNLTVTLDEFGVSGLDVPLAVEAHARNLRRHQHFSLDDLRRVAASGLYGGALVSYLHQRERYRPSWPLGVVDESDMISRFLTDGDLSGSVVQDEKVRTFGDLALFAAPGESIGVQAATGTDHPMPFHVRFAYAVASCGAGGFFAACAAVDLCGEGGVVAIWKDINSTAAAILFGGSSIGTGFYICRRLGATDQEFFQRAFSRLGEQIAGGCPPCAALVAVALPDLSGNGFAISTRGDLWASRHAIGDVGASLGTTLRNVVAVDGRKWALRSSLSVPSAGRNDPCGCGSSVKSKRCCTLS